jgi:F0F1-type ATP synthase membrane subunit b/b'
MEIVLAVAIVAVAAAALYVTATFNKRARQTTAPLIEDAVSRISERIQAAEDDLRRQLGVITDDLHQDLAQQRLNDMKTQDLLDQLSRNLRQLPARSEGVPEPPRAAEPPEAGPGLSGPGWP